MTISKDLFLAILSMDSYNRGYDAGIMNDGSNDPDGLGDASDGTAHIGSATVSYNLADAGIENTSESVGFYAIAYTLGATVGEGNDTMASGQTIISYRGTDNILGLGTPASDLLNGWSFAAGIQTSTLGLAREFYEAVTGTTSLFVSALRLTLFGRLAKPTPPRCCG